MDIKLNNNNLKIKQQKNTGYWKENKPTKSCDTFEKLTHNMHISVFIWEVHLTESTCSPGFYKYCYIGLKSYQISWDKAMVLQCQTISEVLHGYTSCVSAGFKNLRVWALLKLNDWQSKIKFLCFKNLLSGGGKTQQDISNPGGSWGVLMITSSSKWQRSQKGGVLPWTLFSP